MKCCLLVLPLLVLTGALSAAPLVGTVQGPDGKPVAGADVYLASSDREAAGQTVSDARGAFTLALAQPLRPEQSFSRWTVFAMKAGVGLGGITSAGDGPVSITLSAPATVRGRVENGEGQPLSGAHVTLSYLRGKTSRSYIPLRLQPQFTADTDGGGAFTLPAAADTTGVNLTLSAAGCGKVSVYAQVVSGSLPTFTLRPAGRLTARVVCPGAPSAVAYLPLWLSAPNLSEEPSSSAQVTAQADADGKVDVGDLPPGNWTLQTAQDVAVPYQVARVQFRIEPGQTTDLEVKLEPAATVTGRVVSDDTRQPIAGATVHLSTEKADYSAVTDAAGRYSARALPGAYGVSAIAGDKFLFNWSDRPTVTVTAQGLQAPDVVLRRAHRLDVSCVDAAGKPVAGAELSFVGGTDPDTAVATTDARGKATLRTLPAGKRSLTAAKGALRSAVVSAEVGKQQAVRLVLKPRQLAALTVRLLDQHGKPITAAQVLMYCRQGNSGRQISCGGPDSRGCVRKEGLDVGGGYSLQVRAEGCYPVDTAIWQATSPQLHDFGTIVMPRHTASISGRVVDTAGQPVAGAHVFNACDGPRPASATTDAKGGFRLSGLVEGEAYVFAEAPGYAFTAARGPTGSAPLVVTLPAEGQAPTEPVAPADPLAPGSPQAQALLRAVLDEELRVCPAGSDSYQRLQLLLALAKLDPQRALDAAAGKAIFVRNVNLQLGENLLERNFADGLGLMKDGCEPEDLAPQLCEVAGKQAGRNAALASHCLAAAQELLPLIRQTDRRLYATARVGRALRPADPASGEALLRQSAAEAQKIGTENYAGYARRELAVGLADLDLPLALKLTEPFADPNERARCAAQVAMALAPRDPDKAIELVRSTANEWERDRYLSMLVSRLPREQFEQAHRLARGLGNDTARAVALARLAQVAPRERVAALLQEAERALSAPGKQGPDEGLATARAALACVARRLGSPAAATMTRRAVAERTVGSGYSMPASYNFREDFTLVRLVAPFDRHLARHLFYRASGACGGPARLEAYAVSDYISAAADVDPQWAVRLLRQLPPDRADQDWLPHAESALAIILRLSTPPEEREEELLARNYAGRWLVTAEEEVY